LKRLEINLYSLELDEPSILNLPYAGPLSKRLCVFGERGSKNRELFIQRNDAFTTNLAGLLKDLKSREINEIRYATGLDGLVRLFVDDEGILHGEFICKMEKTLENFKKIMGIQ
jgi:hypothetical protein